MNLKYLSNRIEVAIYWF